MTYFPAVKIIDNLGVAQGIRTHSNTLITSDYFDAISRGDISGHTPWVKIGYNGALVASTEADLWSATGAYVFPTAALTMEVLSSNNTADVAVNLKSATADAGGSTTTLYDANGNFVVAGISAGDCLILDKTGTTPEWGYITTVAADTLTCSGGFSSGGVGTSRAYDVLDYNAATRTGAHAVKVEYLNGTTAVPLNTDMFRVNSFRVIAAGSGNRPTGNLTLRQNGGATYSYITALYTRARNVQYTVPDGKTLYVTSGLFSYGYASNSTNYCRMYTRANREPSTGFLTGNIFYPFTEIVAANDSIPKEWEVPTKLAAKTDIKVSAIATYAGVGMVALRGWLE
jgi:hypothetical protein